MPRTTHKTHTQQQTGKIHKFIDFCHLRCVFFFLFLFTAPRIQFAASLPFSRALKIYKTKLFIGCYRCSFGCCCSFLAKIDTLVYAGWLATRSREIYM